MEPFDKQWSTTQGTLYRWLNITSKLDIWLFTYLPSSTFVLWFKRYIWKHCFQCVPVFVQGQGVTSGKIQCYNITLIIYHETICHHLFQIVQLATSYSEIVSYLFVCLHSSGFEDWIDKRCGKVYLYTRIISYQIAYNLYTEINLFRITAYGTLISSNWFSTRNDWNQYQKFGNCFQYYNRN